MNARSEIAETMAAEVKVDDLRERLAWETDCGNPNASRTRAALRRAEKRLSELRSAWRPAA